MRRSSFCENRAVETNPNDANPDFMLSLARGLAIIEAFEDRPGGVTVADISERTGLSRAAVRRALITLKILGYATSAGSIYRLTGRILRIGFSYLSSQPLSILQLQFSRTFPTISMNPVR